MQKIKAFLRFPQEHFSKPITYRLVKEYNLMINILRAEVVANKAGELIMDIEGSEQDIAEAIDFTAHEGIEFRILKSGITLDEERCVHCGACTSVCPSGALTLRRDDWSLVFAPEKCFACELCVKSCPVRAIVAVMHLNGTVLAG